MRVMRGDPAHWHIEEVRRAVAVGVFDGMHLGHLQVLEGMMDLAGARGLETCVVTFDPHPLAVVAPERAPRLLTTVEQRIEVLETLGIDLAAVVPFDDDVRNLSPAAFVSDLLVGRVGTALVVVGEDFRFGRDRTGHVGLLREMGGALGFETEVVPLVGVDRPVSSSRIREFIATGEVAAAASLLGRPYEVIGTVMPADGMGRAIGVPTATLALDEQVAMPARGVYAARAGVDGERPGPAVANVGVRPTSGGGVEAVEVHLLDRDVDLYGRRLRVGFVDRVRDELRFEGPEAPVARIREDIDAARGILERSE